MNIEDIENIVELTESANSSYLLPLKKMEKEVLVPNGECHHCFEEVEGNKLFCDGDCATKYAKYKQINGY